MQAAWSALAADWAAGSVLANMPSAILVTDRMFLCPAHTPACNRSMGLATLRNLWAGASAQLSSMAAIFPRQQRMRCRFFGVVAVSLAVEHH